MEYPRYVRPTPSLPAVLMAVCPATMPASPPVFFSVLINKPSTRRFRAPFLFGQQGIHLFLERLVIEEFVKLGASLHLRDDLLLRAVVAQRAIDIQCGGIHRSKRREGIQS